MLIEFTISNFRSIKSSQTFSLVKDKSSEREIENTFLPDAPGSPALVRSSAIYGPNAAGKSNLLNALRVMQEIVVESASEFQPNDLLPVISFHLDEEIRYQPSGFEVVFMVDGVRFQYGFSASSTRIWEEWLFAYPEGRAQRWIDRSWDAEKQSYVWGNTPKLKGRKKDWQDKTRSNALFLSTATQWNSEQLKPIYDWFQRMLRITSVGGWSKHYSTMLCHEESERSRIIAFLQAADLGINDIKVVKQKFNPDDLPNDMPETIKQEIIEKFDDKELLEVKVLHRTMQGSTVTFDLDEESDGTQKMFAFAGPWLDSLKNGYVLCIDELHDNLHPKLVSFLVELFHNPETNPKNAQLIFTTHETSILSQEVFRRDQIWFCEKNDEMATDLIPLTDFSPRKGRENLEAAYLTGRYGALPYVGKLKIA